jgi:hypothetical protein
MLTHTETNMAGLWTLEDQRLQDYRCGDKVGWAGVVEARGKQLSESANR